MKYKILLEDEKCKHIWVCSKCGSIIFKPKKYTKKKMAIIEKLAKEILEAKAD